DGFEARQHEFSIGGKNSSHAACVATRHRVGERFALYLNRCARLLLLCAVRYLRRKHSQCSAQKRRRDGPAGKEPLLPVYSWRGHITVIAQSSDFVGFDWSKFE